MAVTRTKTILFVSPFPWSGWPRLLREVEALRKCEKFRPVVIESNNIRIGSSGCLSGSLSSEVEIGNDVETYSVPHLVFPISNAKTATRRILCILFYALLEPLYVASIFFSLLYVIPRRKPCLIHVHGTPDTPGIAVLLASKILKVPYVHEVHDLTAEIYSFDFLGETQGLVYHLLKIIEQTIIENASALVVPSNFARVYFRERFGGGITSLYSSWSLKLLRQWTHTASRLKARILNKYKIEGKSVVLYSGSMHRRSSGLEDVIMAVEQVLKLSPNVVLVIAGKGNAMGYLKKIVGKRGISKNTIFTGFITRPEVFSIMKTASAVVIPHTHTLNSKLAVTNKMLEAFALGRPVIAGNLWGNREIVKHGYNGLLFDPDDVKDLAAKITTVINDHKLAQKIGRNAHKDFVGNLSWETQEPKLFSLYERIGR